MTSRELTLELLKFNPQEVAAVYDLGWALDVGMQPTQEQVVDAAFALERLAEAHPAYAPVYRGLLEAIDAHLAMSMGVANPAGLDTLEAQGELCRDSFQESNPGDQTVQVEVKAVMPDGSIKLAEFPHEGTAFDLDTCDHHDLPPALDRRVQEAEYAQEVGMAPGAPRAPAVARNPAHEDDEYAQAMIRQQLMLLDDGPLPVPWARYAETFNYEEAPPPWATAAFDQDQDRIISIAPETRYSQMALAANPRRKKAWKPREHAPAAYAGVMPTYMLGTNAKLAKGGEKCWLSAGFSMLPWTLGGVKNMCPFASKGCSTACLNISGHAEMEKDSNRVKILNARKARTNLYLKHPEFFFEYLQNDVQMWLRKAGRGAENCERFRLSLRMNVLSDQPWELIKYTDASGRKATLMDLYPDICFYDYTKRPARMQAFLRKRFPENYCLTFSWSEINAPVAFDVLDHGGNVAMAFDTKKGRALPKTFCGYPVIDADLTDFRFLDNDLHADVRKAYPGKGLICGLRLKGKRHIRNFAAGLAAEGDLQAPSMLDTRGIFTGGFVQYSEDCGMRDGKQVSKNLTDDPWYKDRLIAQARKNEADQFKEGFLGTQGWRWDA